MAPIALNIGSECDYLVPKISKRVPLEQFAIKDESEEDLLDNWQIFMNLLKTSVGSGIMGLPFAVKSGGLVLGPLLVLLSVIMIVYSCHLIYHCSRELCKRDQVDSYGYGDVCDRVVADKWGKKWGSIARAVVDAMLIVTQLGFCASLLVFTSDNLRQVFGFMDERWWIVVVAIFILPFSFIKSGSFIAYISAAANFIIVIGLLGIWQYLLRNLDHSPNLRMVGRAEDIPICISISIYAFGVIGIVLPTENKARKKKEFLKIFDMSNILAAILYLCTGVFGYVAIGESVHATLTLNLPSRPCYVIVRLLFTVGMTLSYFIEFYIPMQVLVPRAQRACVGNQKRTDALVRVTTLSLTVIVAVAVPQFGNVVSLIGATGTVGLELVIPGMVHFVCFYREAPRSVLVVDVLLSVVGVAISLCATTVTVMRIVDSYENGAADVRESSVGVMYELFSNNSTVPFF